MFCSQCGKEISNDSVFCSGCGVKLNATTANEPVQPTTKEGWMLLAIKDKIAADLKDPESAKFGDFENVEVDAYGRTYAELVVRAKNSFGAYATSRYVVAFFDVTDSAPCTLIPPSPILFPDIIGGTMVNEAHRKLSMAMKQNLKFGSPR